MSVWLEACENDVLDGDGIISAEAARTLQDLGLVIITQVELAELQLARVERSALLDALRSLGIDLFRRIVGDRAIWSWRLTTPIISVARLALPGIYAGLRVAAYGAIREYARAKQD